MTIETIHIDSDYSSESSQLSKSILMHPIHIHILLVEDNEGDIVLTLEAFKEAKVHNKISVVRDGEEAMAFLFRQGQYKDAEIPHLILLDINLPKIDGKEVLQQIKADEALRKIPVIMLTTSSSEMDILDSYNNYANCYITKPVDLNKFIEVIHTVEEFWISIVQLPKTGENVSD
jgi:two-component system, chemotaxis family, response regulator Rcp1